MKNKKGIAFLTPLLVIVAVLILVYVIAHIPQICFVGFCFRIVNEVVAKIMDFYLIIIIFVLLQAVIFYGYWFLVKTGVLNLKKIVNKFKQWSFSIEKWVYVHS